MRTVALSAKTGCSSGKLSILAIDLYLKFFDETYYHIWAYETIRAGQADDLISRRLLPTFQLAL
jgi:hypothetical protein